MTFYNFKNTALLFVFVMISCGSKSKTEIVKNDAMFRQAQHDKHDSTEIIVGANQIEKYVPLLKGKRIAIVANQTSVIFNDGSMKTEEKSYTHLVDSLISLKVNITTVFSPEHGFRGKADAGEVVKDGKDIETGLPIISLYGKNKKPSKEQLDGIDIIIFDIQDVGVRFYTYISTLHYIMEASAEANIPLIILDRPNPNGHYVDGPTLEIENKSFVGMHPIPVVHGMTISEYAQMINREQWLKNGVKCELTVIPIKNYNHKTPYSLPIKPSPNLPNDKAINLYPSLCFFEGTNVSSGRGTEKQFQIFGSPFLNKSIYSFEFTPQPNQGSKYPKHEGNVCHGFNLSQSETLNTLNLEYLINAYTTTSDKSEFFNKFFTKLAGTTKLQQQIEAHFTETEIKATWQEGLEVFKKTRAKYLIYD